MADLRYEILDDGRVRYADSGHIWTITGDVANPNGATPELIERERAALTKILVAEMIAGEESTPPGGLAVTRLADVAPETVTWLWRGYVPAGKLTLWDGDPALGKSTATLDVAARISRGRAMPDGSRSGIDGPAAVVLLTVEDGLGDTVRPRLDAASADVDHVYAIVGRQISDEHTDVVTLPDDVPEIERLVSDTGARLVVIDPLMAFLGARTNSHRDQDVRRALAPLAAMGERTGAAIIVVRHLNKNGGNASPLYRGGGSIGIIGAARSGLLVAPDPDDDTGERRILAITKSNLAAMPPALAYRLADAGNGAARIEWLGPTTHRASQLLAEPGDDEQRSALDDAVDYLRAELADGPRAARDMQRDARSIGISERTLKRARQRLEVTATRAGGVGGAGYWEWCLPAKGAMPEDGPLSGASSSSGGGFPDSGAENNPTTKGANGAKGANASIRATVAPLGVCGVCGTALVEGEDGICQPCADPDGRPL